ncbi:hypothetical protein NCCP436_08440 [Pseudomonas sp. NCCP-436]|nr:hypothetical protein NCCP436_08440 [Pseudomonas sp. NCCP-436]
MVTSETGGDLSAFVTGTQSTAGIRDGPFGKSVANGHAHVDPVRVAATGQACE